MQIISYAVRVDYHHESRVHCEYLEFELYDAKRPNDTFIRSLYLTLRWVTGKNGDFRKAS